MTDTPDRFVTYTGEHQAILLNASGTKRRLIRDVPQQVPNTIADAAEERDDCKVTKTKPAARKPLEPGTVVEDPDDE